MLIAPKLVKATDFTFSVLTPMDSPDMTPLTFLKRGLTGVIWPLKIHLAEICTLTGAF